MKEKRSDPEYSVKERELNANRKKKKRSDPEYRDHYPSFSTNQYKYSVTSTSVNSGKTGIGQENNNVVKPIKPVQLMGAEVEDEDVYSDAFFIFYFF